MKQGRSIKKLTKLVYLPFILSRRFGKRYAAVSVFVLFKGCWIKSDLNVLSSGLLSKCIFRSFCHGIINWSVLQNQFTFINKSIWPPVKNIYWTKVEFCHFFHHTRLSNIFSVFTVLLFLSKLRFANSENYL